jgi:hypothetical protein
MATPSTATPNDIPLDTKDRCDDIAVFKKINHFCEFQPAVEHEQSTEGQGNQPFHHADKSRLPAQDQT